jgi:hypothetical protein
MTAAGINLVTILVSLYFSLISSLMMPQDDNSCVAGIYKTKADLVQDRISHKINTGDKGYSFGFLFPADLKLTIKLVTPDSTHEFPPGSVYGYHKCGLKFRYYPGGDILAQEDYYMIEEMRGLIIYSSVFISGSEKFYSLDLDAPIRRLQLNNIEKDFAHHPKFIEAVKRYAKEKLPVDITRKDEKGRYEINNKYTEYVNPGSQKQ